MSMLDGALVRDRRRQLGLSQRALARLLGVTSTAVRGIEEGANHGDLTLRQAGRLADALGLALGELLADDARPPGERAPGDDAERIGQILHDAGRRLPADMLADVLGWPLDRAHAALGELSLRLDGTGLRLHRYDNTWSVVPAADAVGRKAWAETARSYSGRYGLRENEAKTLARAAAGRLGPDWERHADNDQRVCVQRLLRNGLIAETPDGLRLSADVAYALEPASPAMPPSDRAACASGRR